MTPEDILVRSKRKDLLWGLAIGALWSVIFTALVLWDEQISGPTTSEKPFTDNRAFDALLYYCLVSLVALPIVGGLGLISMRRFWGIVAGVGIVYLLSFFITCLQGC